MSNLRAPGKSGKAKLYESIREEVANGALAPGDRIASYRALQRTFDLSLRAVSETIARLVAEGYLVTRHGSGVYVAKRPDSYREKLKIKIVLNKRSGIEGLLLQSIEETLAQTLEEEGALPVLFQTDAKTKSDLQKDVQACFDDADIDAYVWVVHNLGVNVSLPPKPTVLVAHNMETVWPRHRGYDIVSTDSRQGGALAGLHLRERGCRHVAVVASRGTVERRAMAPASLLRLRGFEEGWGDSVPDGRVFPIDSDSCWRGKHISHALLNMKRRPDGIFAISDDIARTVCFSLQIHDIKPGKDIKVVGFDAQPNLEEQNFTLTSVAAPLEELGREAARAVIARAQNPDAPMRRVNVGCDLRVGDTT